MQRIFNTSMLSMKSGLPWLFQFDARRWGDRDALKSFLPVDIQFAKVARIRFLVPCGKVHHRGEHSIEEFQTRCQWNVFFVAKKSICWRKMLRPMVNILLPFARVHCRQDTTKPFVNWFHPAPHLPIQHGSSMRCALLRFFVAWI